MLLLILRHRFPHVIALPVDTEIEQLRANEDENIVNTDANEDSISATIEWLVVIPIYLRKHQTGTWLMSERNRKLTYVGSYDRAHLHRHVIEG